MSTKANNTPASTESVEETTQSTDSTEESNLETSADEGSTEASDENSEVNKDSKTLKVENQAKKEEIKQLKKKYKLKVDGKELEEEVNLDDDEYMTRQLQLAKAAQKRMGEYSQLEKEVRTFIEELRKNPRKVLADPTIGIDIKNLAKEIIEEEIANSQKSPEQLEKEKLEKELKAIKEEREKEKEESKKKELERLQQQEYERYDMLMTQALDKSDLPKSPYVVKKIADYMLLGLEQGHDITPEDVLPIVREEMQNDLKDMFAVMPDEVIEALVGKDVISRIRKKNIAKAKQQPPAPLKSAVKDTGQSSDNNKDEPKQKKTIKELFGV